MVKIANLKIGPESRGSLSLCSVLELNHTIMSKLWDLGGRTKRKERKKRIYYRYAPDVSNLVVLSYVYDCVFWDSYEELGNWFVDTLGKCFRVSFLGYAHWLISIIISQLKNY